MKKYTKLTSSFMVALLAVGAGVALSGANEAQVVETKAEETKTLYLELNSFQEWEIDNAKFSVWSIDTSTFTDFMVEEMEHMYKVDVPANTTKVIFVRHNSAAESPTWENKWNQTEDLTIKDSEHDFNACRITGWGEKYSTCSLFPANPVDDGYYLVGTMNSWTANEDSKMSFDSQKNEYSKEQAFAVDAEFKVVSYSRYLGRHFGASKLIGGEGSAKDAGQIVPADEGDSNMKVVTAGTYTPYVKAGDDNKIWISALEETHTYTLDVVSGGVPTTYNLIKGVGTEFVTETKVPVLAGDVLAFSIDNVLQTINPKAIGNNNCYSDEDGVTTVLLNMNENIYVDFGNQTVFCDGMTHGEFGLVVDNNYVRMTKNDTPVDPSFTEWYKQGFTFAEGADIKFVDTTSSEKVATVFSVLKINESSTEGFEVIDEHLLCTADGGKTTDIYVKFKLGEDEVYFGDVAEDMAAAIAFAKGFNSALESVCIAYGQTEIGQLQSAWEGQARQFANILGSAKEILKSATSQHANNDIKAFADKYDYVYARYADQLGTHGGNFVERSVTPVGQVYFASSNGNNKVTIAVVIAVSVVSVSALGILLFIKKRKYN